MEMLKEPHHLPPAAGCVYAVHTYGEKPGVGPVGEFLRALGSGGKCLVTGRAGSYQEDPMCKEVPHETDECCVAVQCESNAEAKGIMLTWCVGPHVVWLPGIVALKDVARMERRAARNP
ncbi:hypothetical protein GWK47_022081 [Chionoecetes opilio]|uniref:Uncharacterized protein n=1 Tax=Chionoecetes opilio TaxID=41210 RepID=A0A8J4XN78_CHIOP|nr:hypothetical protein GWK47_022081 [Chionoecetes opilio]